ELLRVPFYYGYLPSPFILKNKTKLLKIAIVILNWNGKELLEQFLPSIIKHSKQATIYVADNASTDHSVLLVKQHFPEAKIIQNTINGRSEERRVGKESRTR